MTIRLKSYYHTELALVRDSVKSLALLAVSMHRQSCYCCGQPRRQLTLVDMLNGPRASAQTFDAYGAYAYALISAYDDLRRAGYSRARRERLRSAADALLSASCNADDLAAADLVIADLQTIADRVLQLRRLV